MIYQWKCKSVRPKSGFWIALNWGHKSKKWWWSHNLLARRYRQSFNVVVCLLSSRVTGPIFELWQFSFIRDFIKNQTSERLLCEFCSMFPGDRGESGMPNAKKCRIKNVGSTAFTVSQFLRKTIKKGKWGKYTSPHT